MLVEEEHGEEEEAPSEDVLMVTAPELPELSGPVGEEDITLTDLKSRKMMCLLIFRMKDLTSLRKTLRISLRTRLIILVPISVRILLL